jgi:UDPglucose 6-dehydrogenase
MKKVAMIGVGKLGQDCAEVMFEAGHDVVGYDVEVRDPMFPMKDSIEDAVQDRDLIFIAAPTPHDPIYGGETPTSHLPNKDFDYTIVKNILNEVNKHVNKNQLVVLISTVLPGTVRNQLEPCITNARFIYNPYLIAMGTIKWDMVNPEMVIIGTEDGSLTGDAKELVDFYKGFMTNNPRYEVGTWDEAEAIKIFYNTFISTKLALVNMIQDVAERNGNMNVDVVTSALANSTYRIMGPAYMKAGLGDAGACHPRDNIALRYLADRLELGYDLFDAIMKAREVQAENMALKCLAYGKNVVIVGKAYKPKVPYTHGSASMLVGHYIEKHGGTVKYFDIHTGDTDTNWESIDVFLIGYWESYVEQIVFPQHAIVIDPWRKVKNINVKKIVHYGDTRKSEKSNDLTTFTPYEHVAPNGAKVELVPIDVNVLDSAKGEHEWILNSGIKVKSPRMFDGGGFEYKDFLIETIKKTGKHCYNRAFEWCSGFGVLGFESLGMGMCNHIVFSDYHPKAIETCLENAKNNNLTHYVTGYVSPTISEIPQSELWDLVISNPPHAPDFNATVKGIIDEGQDPRAALNSTRLIVDSNWTIHKEFMENIVSHLQSEADIYLIENQYYDFLVHLGKLVGLRYIDTYNYPEEHSTGTGRHVIMHFKGPAKHNK